MNSAMQTSSKNETNSRIGAVRKDEYRMFLAEYYKELRSRAERDNRTKQNVSRIESILEEVDGLTSPAKEQRFVEAILSGVNTKYLFAA